MSSGNSPAEELPEDLKAVEKALRRLTPAASQIDRDRLLYLAGQASAMSAGAQGVHIEDTRSFMPLHRNWWPVATAALALFSLGLGGLLIHATRPSERVVYVEVSRDIHDGGGLAAGAFSPANNATGGTSSAGSEGSYFQLRDLVLTHGIEALPQAPSTVRPIDPQTTQPLWPVLHSHLIGDES
jgi:hypothetical protein